jgi:hypothetical protein
MRCPCTVVCVLRVNFFYFHKKEINACRMHASYWAFIRTLASPSLLGIQFLKWMHERSSNKKVRPASYDEDDLCDAIRTDGREGDFQLRRATRCTHVSLLPINCTWTRTLMDWSCHVVLLTCMCLISMLECECMRWNYMMAVCSSSDHCCYPV